MEQEQYNELVNYVSSHLSQGSSEGDIRSVLYANGWDKPSVDSAFRVSTQPFTQYQHNQSDAVQTHPTGPLHTAAEPSSIHQNSASNQEKYKVLQALKDLGASIKVNPAVCAATLLPSTVISVLLFFGSQSAADAVLQDISIFTLSRNSVALILVVNFILLFLVTSIILTVFLILLTPLLQHGYTGRRVMFSRHISDSISSFWRVFKAEFVTSIITQLPLFISSYMALFTLLFVSSVPLDNGGFATILVLFNTLWLIIASLTYPLAPILSSLNTTLTVRQALSRSSVIMRKQGGQWYLIKASVVFFILTVVILRPESLRAFTELYGLSVFSVAVIACAQLVLFGLATMFTLRRTSNA